MARTSEGSGSSPLLSLGLPVYNGERFLPEAIESVLAQDLDDWELLISDNASTDRTGEIARKYAELDPRISYVRHARNLGAAPNHNYGFHHTTGEHFAWVQHDNRYHPSYFRRCIEELRAHPEASAVHSRVVDIDEHGAAIGTPWDEGLRCADGDVAVRFRDLTENDHMCFAWFAVVRRDVLAQTSLHASFDSADRLTIAQLALRGPVRVLDEVLFEHREHPGRMVRQAPTARSIYLVLDPAWQGRVPFPVLNIGRQYLRSVLSAPLTPYDRMRCVLALRGWLRTNRRRIPRTIARGGVEYARLAASALRAAPRRVQAGSA